MATTTKRKSFKVDAKQELHVLWLDINTRAREHRIPDHADLYLQRRVGDVKNGQLTISAEWRDRGGRAI